jgi:hypothetical protein
MDRNTKEYFDNGLWEVKGVLEAKSHVTNVGYVYVEWELVGTLGNSDQVYQTNKLAKNSIPLHCQVWSFYPNLLILTLSYYCFEDNGKKYKFIYDLYDIYHDVMKGQFSFSTEWTVDDKKGGDQSSKASFTFKRIGDKKKEEEK